MADPTVVDLLREHGMVFRPTVSPNHLARFIVRNAAGRRVFDGSEAEIEAWLRELKAPTFKVRCRLAKRLARDIIKDKRLATADEILEAICDMGWANGAAEATELLDGERYHPAEQRRAKRSDGRDRRKHAGRTYK